MYAGRCVDVQLLWSEPLGNLLEQVGQHEHFKVEYVRTPETITRERGSSLLHSFWPL